MDKNDKALAVELTSAYVTALMKMKNTNGEHVYPAKITDVEKALTFFYEAIKKLD